MTTTRTKPNISNARTRKRHRKAACQYGGEHVSPSSLRVSAEEFTYFLEGTDPYGPTMPDTLGPLSHPSVRAALRRLLWGAFDTSKALRERRRTREYLQTTEYQRQFACLTDKELLSLGGKRAARLLALGKEQEHSIEERNASRKDNFLREAVYADGLAVRGKSRELYRAEVFTFAEEHTYREVGREVGTERVLCGIAVPKTWVREVYRTGLHLGCVPRFFALSCEPMMELSEDLAMFYKVKGVKLSGKDEYYPDLTLEERVAAKFILDDGSFVWGMGTTKLTAVKKAREKLSEGLVKRLTAGVNTTQAESKAIGFL